MSFETPSHNSMINFLHNLFPHYLSNTDKTDKLVQYEISSSAVQANSSHAWVHKCMGAQKKRKESACLAFELISYGVSLFSFVGGIDYSKYV